MENKHDALMQRIYDTAKADLSKSYDLISISYDDKLTKEQVALLARDEWEGLWESFDAWEPEARYEGVSYYREELVDDAVRTLVRAGEIDEDDEYELRQAFEDTDLWEELRWAIEERDTGDWLKELASNSGHVLMRVPMYGSEDQHFNFSAESRGEADPDVEDVITQVGLPYTEKNIAAVQSILNETGHDYKWPFLLFAMQVSDLYELMTAPGELDQKRIVVTDPHLFLTNIYAGDGYEEELEGEFILDASRLMTDDDAPGYGWNNIASVVVSAYECDVRIWDPWKEAAA